MQHCIMASYNHHSLGQASRARAEAQECTNILVLLAFGYFEAWELTVFSKRFSNIQEGFHCRETLQLALEKEDPMLWDPCVLCSGASNVHCSRHGHKEFSAGLAKRVSHLFDVVRW